MLQYFDYFWHIGPRGVFLLMIRRESVTPLAVFRCIVPGCIAYGGIEMFAVNEFNIDVFVAISSDNAGFRRSRFDSRCQCEARWADTDMIE